MNMKLNDQTIKELVKLADKIDGSLPLESKIWIAQFNQVSGMNLTHQDFQNVYGAGTYEQFVRNILVLSHVEDDHNLSHDELTRMFQSVIDAPFDDDNLINVFAQIEKAFPKSRASDLVFWPGEYFGDGNQNRKLTAKEMADEILRVNSRI